MTRRAPFRRTPWAERFQTTARPEQFSSAEVSSASAVHNLSTVRMQDLARHVGGVIRRQKHIARGHLLRLAGSSQRRILSEFLHFFGRKRRRDQRRPDRSRRDTIDAYATRREVLRQRSRKRHNGSLGRRII